MKNETMNNEQSAISDTPYAMRHTPKPRLGWIISWIIVIGLLALAAVRLYQIGLGPADSGGAPDFTLTTFEGDQIELSSLRGQVVVVNFWASWCIPCEKEAPDLEAFHRDYKDRGVVLLGVNWADTESAARDYLRKFDITYLNGPDLGTRISQTFRITGVPETYIIDRDGQLVKAILLPTTKADLAAIVEPLLR